MPYKDPEKRREVNLKSQTKYRTKLGKSEWNKRAAERMRKHRHNSPNSDRNSKYKYKYGITLEDYNTMFIKQNGCCAICGQHQNELNKTLHVDHNHDDTTVRGLLCKKCNSLLGMADDNINILYNAIEYLKGQ